MVEDQERDQIFEEIDTIVGETAEIERTLQKVLNIALFLLDRT
jgi:hypothetical protein